MQKRDVPVLVFSAGLADIIEEVSSTNTFTNISLWNKLQIRKKYYFLLLFLAQLFSFVRFSGRNYIDLLRISKLFQTEWCLMKLAILLPLKVFLYFLKKYVLVIAEIHSFKNLNILWFCSSHIAKVVRMNFFASFIVKIAMSIGKLVIS